MKKFILNGLLIIINCSLIFSGNNDSKTIAITKEILQEYKKNNLKKEAFTPTAQFKNLDEKKIKSLQPMLLSEKNLFKL